ncbi:hypothetical protein G6O69_37620 [Pseudenhygromyxa sp. WMMC2535]|nr:hypothetical protein [Pseudenhygromyxa sp. WMMC2535]NVB43591.1 hypothetical protein [Pseudenhygromyxa sp. WMMC2535]
MELDTTAGECKGRRLLALDGRGRAWLSSPDQAVLVVTPEGQHHSLEPQLFAGRTPRAAFVEGVGPELPALVGENR